MKEKIDTNRYPNQRGTEINIGFTFNNETARLCTPNTIYQFIFEYTNYYNYCTRIIITGIESIVPLPPVTTVTPITPRYPPLPPPPYRRDAFVPP